MIEPISLLTEEDRETITAYIKATVGKEFDGGKDVSSLDSVLADWNQNKRTLLKALGGQLRVTIPTEQDMNFTPFYKKIKTIYRENLAGSPAAGQIPFPQYFYRHLINDCSCTAYLSISKPAPFFISDARDIDYICSLFRYDTIYNGVTPRTYILQRSVLSEDGEVVIEKTLKIPAGMKIIKAIFKIVHFYEFYQYEDLQEKWRNAISDLQTQQHLKFNLTISIHPIDFMTMSDNAYGWTSCMSWENDGCYSSGTIEMLNSNIMAVAYLSNGNKDFYDGRIPNKAWRSLVYIHKKILVVGKNYPYRNDDITIDVLDFVRELVRKNLNWHYRFINQLYGDMRNSDSSNHHEISLYRHLYTKSKTSKHIYLCTNNMYNDLAEDYDYPFYCCRNYVEHDMWISASGRLTCMYCGRQIYHSTGRDKLCHHCRRC